MRAETEEKLFSFGGLFVLVGTCIFAYVALSSDWRYSVAAVCLISGWVCIYRLRLKRNHLRDFEALKAEFTQKGLPVPELKEGNNYGFRAFTLTFASETELKKAKDAGCIAAFKQAIQGFYGHTGSKRNPFDAERAVWATYKGWQPRFTAK
jgi:hypothetical protein